LTSSSQGYWLRSRFHTFTSLDISYKYKKGFHTKVRVSSRIGPHNQDVLGWSLLGDAYGNARIIECHHSIYITKDSIPKLINLVLPHVIPSMRYKLRVKDNQ